MSQLTDEQLKSAVEDLIRTEIFIRDVPYSMQDGLQELDPGSVDDASKAIVKFFKELNKLGMLKPESLFDNNTQEFFNNVGLSDSPVVDVIKKFLNNHKFNMI